MKTIWLAAAAAVCTAPLAAQEDPRARLFQERGCSECHAVSALRIAGKTDVGPDLSYAYAEVPQRYGLTLEHFLNEPSGVMRLVLGGHIQLTRAERAALVDLFSDLYAQHLARLDSLRRGLRPVPTTIRRAPWSRSSAPRCGSGERSRKPSRRRCKRFGRFHRDFTMF